MKKKKNKNKFDFSIKQERTEWWQYNLSMLVLWQHDVYHVYLIFNRLDILSNQNCGKLSRLEIFFFFFNVCIVRAYIESHFQCSFKTSLELSTVVCMYGPLYLTHSYSKTSSLGYTLSSHIIFMFLSQNSCLTFVSLCNVIINMITQIVQI